MQPIRRKIEHVFEFRKGAKAYFDVVGSYAIQGQVVVGRTAAANA